MVKLYLFNKLKPERKHETLWQEHDQMQEMSKLDEKATGSGGYDLGEAGKKQRDKGVSCCLDW